MRRFVFLATAVLLTCTGCGTTQADTRQQPPVTQSNSIYQRFVPVAPTDKLMEGVPWHGYFALDTKRGMLCLTTSKTFTGSAEWANSLRTCEDVRSTSDDDIPATPKPKNP